MALKNIKNHGCGAVVRNLGILKTDQVELVAKTTAPSDSDLADARVYYNSTNKVYYGRANSLWFPLGGTTKVNAITTTITLTTSQSGQIFKCASVGGSLYIKLPAPTTSGIVYHIVQDSVNAATGNLSICPQSATSEYWIAGSSGTLTLLDTRGDCLTLVSDGSTAWIATSRYHA